MTWCITSWLRSWSQLGIYQNYGSGTVMYKNMCYLVHNKQTRSRAGPRFEVGGGRDRAVKSVLPACIRVAVAPPLGVSAVTVNAMALTPPGRVHKFSRARSLPVATRSTTGPRRLTSRCVTAT